MSVLNSSTAAPPSRIVPLTRQLAPGIALAAAVAVAASLSAPRIATVFPIPAMVIALLLGIALNGLASQKAFEPGLAWCVKKLLRIAIGLLGIRIALGDIVDLGLGVALLVVARHGADRCGWDPAGALLPARSRLRRARGRGDRRVRRLGGPRHRDGGAELPAEGRRRDLHGGGRQRRLHPRHGRLSAALPAARPRCADDRDHARGHHPRHGSGGRRRLRRLRAGRQHGRHRQAVPRVSAAADGARHRLVFHASARRSRRGQGAGAGLRARVPRSLPRQQPRPAGARPRAHLRPGQVRSSSRLPTGGCCWRSPRSGSAPR